VPKSTILITGLESLISAAIISHLLRAGHEVLVSSRSTTGIRMTDAATGRMFRTLFLDLTEESTFQNLPSSIDTVIHAAAASSTEESLIRVIDTNFFGTQRLIDYALTAGVSRFIYLSSVSAFGTISEPVISEDTPSVNPGAYGISKLLGEKALAQVNQKFMSVSLRLPAVLSPYSRNHWLARLRSATQRNEPISAVNPDFLFNNAIHVDTCAAFVAKLVESDWSCPSSLLLASTCPVSVSRVVEIIIEEVRSQSIVTYKHQSIPSFTISCELAMNWGYEPLTIEQTLKKWLR
jgi:nucleoside-diphosphate-sugar epimerase